MIHNWINIPEAKLLHNVPNKRACTIISGQVCPLTLIASKRQTLPEINMHARLFGTLEYFFYGEVHPLSYLTNFIYKLQTEVSYSR